MHFRLRGHDYRYAMEQILLSLLPEERPFFLTKNEPPPPETSALADVTLSHGKQFSTAKATVHLGEGVACGTAKAKTPDRVDKVAYDRVMQRLV